MSMMYFGPPWDAPALDDAVQLPETPTYARCTRCRELFADGDQGHVIPHVGELDPDYLVGIGAHGVSLAGTHRECFMAGIVGHAVGVCVCTGWDPTDRATSREVQRRVAAGALG